MISVHYMQGTFFTSLQESSRAQRLKRLELRVGTCELQCTVLQFSVQGILKYNSKQAFLTVLKAV